MTALIIALEPDAGAAGQRSRRHESRLNRGDGIDEHLVGPIRVTADASGVHVSIPELDDAGPMYDPLLTPTTLHNFERGVQDYSRPVTFILGEDASAEYLRTRYFVAARQP